MAAPSVSTSLLAIGGNRHPEAADWSIHGTFAFGASRAVALWNPNDPNLRGVYTTLKGHSEKVNVVRFLPARPKEDEIIVTGAADCTLRLWRKNKEGEFTQAAVVEGIHTASLNTIATCREHPTIFASSAADGTIAVFKVDITADSLAVQHFQTINTKPKFFALTIALSGLPTSPDSIILVAGGSITTIAVYIAPSPATPFALQATLPGHENWVRHLAITHEDPANDDSDLIVSSASQDRYIRLWRIHPGTELPKATAKSESKTFGFASRLSNKAHMLKVSSGDSEAAWSMTFEALLMGHEDWIYTSRWKPNATKTDELRLLSCSADNSISVWAQEEDSGTWNPVSRFGELSNLKGGNTATGSAGGIWNALWSPDGKTVAALTKSGAWRVYRYDEAADRWNPHTGITGHIKVVQGISWARDGGYLLSTSLDQTTRLWACEEKKGEWHEFSRPQIHGYDINCIASVGADRFVSGAEEKLLRVFDEPKAVAETLEKLCGLQQGLDKDTLLDAAGLPVLGLSNKPLDASVAVQDDEEAAEEGEDAEPTEATALSADTTSDEPPLEENLSRLTLWPETEKLYGHGYEISALAASPVSRLIATACKASTIDHAVIRLYDGDKNWEELKPTLQSHSLTVTSLSFSGDGKTLLSTGRDRAWSLFTTGEKGQWELVERRDKAHTRIVFDCAWMPSGEAFVTASRDKSVKLWSRKDGKWEATATVKFESPVTAVDVVGEVLEGVNWVAVGLEDGTVEVWKVGEGKWEVVEKYLALDSRITPDNAITELTWRPMVGPEKSREKSSRDLAVASEDASVRIYTVPL